MNKKTLYTNEVMEFLEYIRDNHSDYIKKHQRHNDDSPVIYEIDRNKIHASYISDVCLCFGNSELQEMMTQIAYYTNNVFRCGCMFTIG